MTSRCTSSHLARNHQGLLSEPELARQRANDHLWLRKHRDDESSTLVRKMSRPISRLQRESMSRFRSSKTQLSMGFLTVCLDLGHGACIEGKNSVKVHFAALTLTIDSSTLPRQTADGDISAHSENLSVVSGPQRQSF